MSQEDREVERLRRLRERQLDARDPRHADRRREAIVSRRPRETFSIRRELRSLPAKVTWMFWGGVIGLFAGLFFSLVLFLAFQVAWWEYVTTFMILFCAALGRLFGAAKDSGSEDWRK